MTDPFLEFNEEEWPDFLKKLQFYRINTILRAQSTLKCTRGYDSVIGH